MTTTKILTSGFVLKGSNLYTNLFLNINKLDELNFIINLFQASTSFEHMCSSSGGKQLYRCDDTRDCIIQFWPPNDEHICSKHVEVWNKLIIKFSVSIWLILRNKYIEMHGQKNIKTCIQMFATYKHIMQACGLLSIKPLPELRSNEGNFRITRKFSLH